MLQHQDERDNGYDNKQYKWQQGMKDHYCKRKYDRIIVVVSHFGRDGVEDKCGMKLARV